MYGGDWRVLSTLEVERAAPWQQLDEQVRYAKMERRRQEKVTLGGSLGTSFSGRCGAGLEKGEGQAKSLIKGKME
ncbi:hypothetical protein O3P69_010114 [Scylla paramamosain]|uniref:Uncharacterized protein n=1 Tax=Scylla paramamosain TaxID=85552 RepID=A0AAW0SAT7_SCYPA